MSWFFRHSGESRNPVKSTPLRAGWTPAFAGVTIQGTFYGSSFLGDAMFLRKIVEGKREEISGQKILLPLSDLKRRLAGLSSPIDFGAALRSRPCAIIAEVKRSSPSKGRIREEFEPVAIARIYAESGAAAISVVTERRFFEGRASFLSEIRRAVQIPLLRKDFIIDAYQLYEARLLGADAVLLIARILDDPCLREFIALSRELGISPLVEVHDEADLEKAVCAGAGLIGINNRDLSTFSTDLGVSLRLAPLVPPGALVVSESGIRSRKDIEKLGTAGIRAFLVGETLMREPDVSRKLKELLTPEER
jgi:indole-3-glycerol phosphate synthase